MILWVKNLYLMVFIMFDKFKPVNIDIHKICKTEMWYDFYESEDKLNE